MIVAETTQALAAAIEFAQLQWGRDLIVAETADDRPTSAYYRRCFNGAAT